MVKSLVELCTIVCLRNTKEITDIGDIPYRIARPILLKIDSAAQLRQIEINSPQLEVDTPELWKRLIARDFPVISRREAFLPKNPRLWHKIYAKYQSLDTKAKQDAKEHLKNAYKGLQEEKDRTVSQVVTYDSRKLPGLPRDVKPQVGIRPKNKRASPDQSELRFTGGSRTKTNTPKSLLKRAMREAKEISTRNRLNTSASAGQVRPGQIVRAPVAMVQEKVNKARPLTGIRPPSHRLQPVARQRELDDREARLQRAKEMNSQKGGCYISDEDLDDLDIQGEDGPIGLEIDDLENLADQHETRYEARLSRPSPSSARGSVFARKMGSSSTSPSTSRIRTEARTEQKPLHVMHKEPTTTTSRSRGPTSPPPPRTTPNSSSFSPGAGSGPMLPRKRKAADIFMKPKPKASRF
ncbi:RNA polymerase II transcription factor SIII subunit A-domain-containing protein [Xylaria sp. FL1777]|nr:RNA polymerase II transcription factor SIII subunit A-domain-containing protein [Xylaria sp. FL1777]